MKVKRCIFFALMAAIAVVIVLRLLPDEKKRLIRDLTALRQAVERKDRSSTLAYISPSYADANGIDYEGLVRIIDNMFSNAASIEIILSRIKPSIDSTAPSHQVFASCSLGLRVFAIVDSQKVLLFGGVIQPSPVRALFTKTGAYYQLYSAFY